MLHRDFVVRAEARNERAFNEVKLFSLNVPGKRNFYFRKDNFELKLKHEKSHRNVERVRPGLSGRVGEFLKLSTFDK